MPLVKVSWPYGCNHMAMVAGSWANWRPQVLVPMKTSSGEVWSAQIKLPDNVDDVFRYKFIVDGDWKYDSALTTLPNDHGDFDSYLVVSFEASVGYIVIIFIIFLIIFIIIFLILLTIFFNNIFSSFLYSKKSAKNRKKIILGRSIGATMQKT